MKCPHCGGEIADGVQQELAPAACPVERVIAAYHERLPESPRVIKRTKARDGHIRARWREYPDLEWFQAYFAKVATSKFLTGRAAGTNGRPPFRADLDWLMKPDNMARVLEGRYR